MKKVTALLLCLVLALGCLAGCSNTTNETQPQGTGTSDVWFGEADGVTPVHIKVWAGIQPEYGYADIIANFNEEYKDKGITAEYVRYMNNTDGNLRVDNLLTGSAEDNIDVLIGYGGSSRMQRRVDSGLLVDYSDFLEEAGFDVTEALGGAAASEFVYEDGSIYGLPTTFGNSGWMMVNKNMFDAAGIEIPYDGWTYSEFEAALEKLTTGSGQDKVWGICWGLNFEHSHTTNFCAEIIRPFNVFTDVNCTETAFDNQLWIDGMSLIADSIAAGYGVPLDEEIAEAADTASYFLTEKCAIFFTNSQIRLAMDTATYGHTFTTAFVPHPVPDSYAEDPNHLLHSNCVSQSDVISVASTSAYPEASAEFARWYITGGILPLIKGGRIPLYNGITQETILSTITELAGDSVDAQSIAAFMSVDKNAIIARVSSDASDEIGDMLWVRAQEILSGQVSAEDGMKALKEEADAVITKYAQQ